MEHLVVIDYAITHGRDSKVNVVIDSRPKVTVRDEGPGISPANIPRIFDRFFTTSRDSGGTGLGLAMVKAIVKAYGADLDVESGEGGTTMTVTFKPNV